MKKNELINKTLAGLMIAAMTAGVCPTTAFAVTGKKVAKDGTYTKTVHVERTAEDDEEENKWDEYDVEVSLTVKDGKFSDITVTPKNGYNATDNATYFNKAYSGKKGIQTKLVGQDATADTVNEWDTKTGATRTSDAAKTAALAALEKAEEAETPVEVNTANLEKAIAKAKGLTAADYTEESWKNLQTALTAADAALTAKESQDAVDKALSNLTAAIDALKKKSEEVKVNTEKLEAAIKKADALKDKEAVYTPNSWKTMQDALTEAKAALAAKESQDKVNAAETKLTAAIGALEAAKAEQPEYVLMNIPYDEFYKADVNNTVPVDAFTSATLNKTRTARYSGGSYHTNADGSKINGITFPVKVDKNVDLSKYKEVTDSDSVTITTTKSGQTKTDTYTGKGTLYENADHAYYALSEAPSYYKKVSVDAEGNLVFGKTVGTVTKIESGVTPELKTKSKYGDYQLNLDGLEDTIVPDTDTVYGVIVSTDQNDYGMRHLENIWKVTKLAWCTGFTDTSNGCPTSADHYKSMMGQTIKKVTYYTSKGIYEIPMDVYVPVKFNCTLSAENASITSGQTKVSVEGLPSDYVAEYKVYNAAEKEKSKDAKPLKNFSVQNGVLTFSDASKGKYTLTVSDKNGKYADVNTDFELYTEAMPAVYDAENTKLVKADDTTDAEFSDYIKNITKVNVNGKDYAASGRGAVKIINDDGTINTKATPLATGDSFEITVTATGYKTLSFTYEKAAEEYKYVYAGLSWAEYWANEGVYAAGNDASSDEVDTKGEHDKGAFDTVTRATTNHGLHRGSYQCTAVIEGANGKEYKVSHWTDANTAVLTDGSTIRFEKGTITESDGSTTTMVEYDVTGIKYVPVKVAAADYDDFCKAYAVVENGGDLTGGYGEGKLASYAVKANVTAQTNGLKTVTKNEDGSFSFSSRESGTESGIEGQALKTAPSADEAGLTVKEANGSYGEFLRVDLTKNFADLGANMQAVKWTYYGDDATYTNAKASYGTKFAADNWMHKSMGIQLGLTDSLRCQLPEGTDGTGYWTITISALGYEDVTYKFQATDANIVKEDPVKDTSALEAAIAKAEGLTESDYTAESWAAMQTELAEAKEELAAKHSQSAVNEATSHLNAAIDALVKVETPAEVNTEVLEAAIAKAEGLKEADYTADSWKAMQTSLTAAKAALEAKESQEAVDAAAANLQSSIGALKAATPSETDDKKAVDTATLEAAIAKAEGLKEADYTADSWKAMQTSLTAAKAALEAKESQEAVDAAAANLQSSIDALKAATPSETDDKKAVDTATLEKTIATVKGLKKNDYTAATWTTLQTALTNAEKALDAKESQKSVDEAAKTLQAAIDGLKKASDTTATTDDKKNNNSNKNNNNSTNKNNTTTNKNNTTSKNSPKTGDPVSVLGLLGAAISSVGIGGLGLRLRKKSKREDEE